MYGCHWLGFVWDGTRESVTKEGSSQRSQITCKCEYLALSPPLCTSAQFSPLFHINRCILHWFKISIKYHSFLHLTVCYRLRSKVSDVMRSYRPDKMLRTWQWRIVAGWRAVQFLVVLYFDIAAWRPSDNLLWANPINCLVCLARTTHFLESRDSTLVLMNQIDRSRNPKY